MSRSRVERDMHWNTWEGKWPRWVHYLIAFAPLVVWGVWAWACR